MKYKQCRKCSKTKAVNATEFAPREDAADGFRHICRVCAAKRQRAYSKIWVERPGVRERLREIQRRHKQTPKGKATQKAWNNTAAGKATQRKTYRRMADRFKVYRQVKKLKKQPCVKCGKKALAHHDDYSKPLDVTWLCQLHHTERHRELGWGYR